MVQGRFREPKHRLQVARSGHNGLPDPGIWRRIAKPPRPDTPFLHALADAEFTGNPVHAHAGGAKFPGAGNRLVRGCRTPEAFALYAGSGKLGHCQVNEDSPLKFSEDA